MVWLTLSLSFFFDNFFLFFLPWHVPMASEGRPHLVEARQGSEADPRSVEANPHRPWKII